MGSGDYKSKSSEVVVWPAPAKTGDISDIEKLNFPDPVMLIG